MKLQEKIEKYLVDALDGNTTIRLGLSSTPGVNDVKNFSNTYHPVASANGGIDIFDVQTIDGDPGYMEWTAGATGGAETHQLSVAEMPSHSHTEQRHKRWY